MFSEQQKLIAKELFEGPLTLQELEKNLKLSREDLQKDLKKMLELKVIEKTQKDEKELFSLKKSIAEELIRRKEISRKDTFDLRLEAYIEMQAIEKKLLEKHLNEMMEKLKNNPELTIYSIKKASIQKPAETEYYSSYIELNFTVKDFSSLIQFMFFYGPSTIEVLKPEKISLKAFDFQDGLMQLADISQKYNTYIRKALNKKELEEFNKKISR